MTHEELFDKYRRWAKKSIWYTTDTDLENAREIVSYDAGFTESSRSGISVRALGAHTDKLHLFIFAVKTTWAQDKDGEDGTELAVHYRLILAF